jgi:hypothetical protein
MVGSRLRIGNEIVRSADKKVSVVQVELLCISDFRILLNDLVSLFIIRNNLRKIYMSL